jgi:general secretion pathway protein N
MSEARRLLAAGTAAFLVFLAAQAPARLGPALLEGNGLRASGISGTLWHGRAQSALLGQLAISDLRWRMSPLPLLLGRAALDIEGRLTDGFVNGRVEIGLRGLLLRDFRLSSTLDVLGAGLGLPVSGGPLSCEIERATVRDGWFTELVGELRLAVLPLPLPTGPGAEPGGFSAIFSATRVSATEPLEGVVENIGGPLELQARVVLTPPTSWELSGLARPLPGAPAELAQGLAMLGPRQPDGSYEFTLTGSF